MSDLKRAYSEHGLDISSHFCLLVIFACRHSEVFNWLPSGDYYIMRLRRPAFRPGWSLTHVILKVI